MLKQEYIIGNSKNVRSLLKQNKIPAPQLILTSPPYYDLLNYNNNKQQIGFGQGTYDDYIETICQVFQDCYDVASDNATFWLVIDTFKKKKEVCLLPFDIVNKLKEKKKPSWILKDIVIWDKGKNLPWTTNGNFKNQHEYILFFSKGDKFKFTIDRLREVLDLKKWWKTYPERYNPDGKAPSNIWNFNTPIRGWGTNKQNHLCPFPFPLVEKIISLCTDEKDWVLDPFAGSGSVLAIAGQMNRNSCGIDINKLYQKRYREEVLTGAETYWEKRKIELVEAKNILDNFKTVNGKLRKLKIASHICAHLNKLNKHPFIYYTQDRPKNSIKIVILQNGRIPTVDLENKELQDLIKQAKISATVEVKKDQEFGGAINNTKAYKYKLDKFYSYTSTCRMKQVIINADKFDYMYSDIELKISNN